MPNKKSSNLDWLQKIRFNSWELEILLVGFVLVVLFQVPNKIEQWSTIKFFYNSTLTNTIEFVTNHMIMMPVISGLYLIVYIIIFSLILYLVLRGFWIAVIGLSSAFPEGIQFSNLNLYEKYENKLATTNFEKISINMDKVCSSVFAFAFLLITFILSLIMLIIIMFLLFGLLFSLNAAFDFGDLYMVFIPMMIYLILSFIYLLDIICFGVLKKIKWKYFAIPYYYIYSMFNFIAFGFIFEKLYFYFISNLSKKTIIFIVIALFIISRIYNVATSQTFSLFPYATSHSKTMSYHFYEDKLNNENLIDDIFDMDFGIPRIQSHIINDNAIELFIPYEALLDYAIENHCNLSAVQDSSTILELDSETIAFDGDRLLGGKNTQIKIEDVLDCINLFYNISINDTINISSDFLLYEHPYFNQKGFFMVVDVSDLKNGSHYLKIQLNSSFNLDNIGYHRLADGSGIWTDSAISENYDNYSIRIPFYNNSK